MFLFIVKLQGVNKTIIFILELLRPGRGVFQFGGLLRASVFYCLLGLGYHTLILFLKGAIMKYQFILFSPWLLKSPV